MKGSIGYETETREGKIFFPTGFCFPNFIPADEVATKAKENRDL
jgi:hypothetical protein